VRAACGIADYQISGPRWFDQERFDIVAKTDAPVTSDDEIAAAAADIEKTATAN
jgi:uncharacterized protein (TIGR03435 family)